MVSAILVFGDAQDLMVMRSDDPEQWIENLVEWNNGQELANWYLDVEGNRYEGAGWDAPVRWGSPEHPYEVQNTRYVLFLGGQQDWSPEVQEAARIIVDRHRELYGTDRVGLHIDLDHGSIRGRDSKLGEWVHNGSPVPKGARMTETTTGKNVRIDKGNVDPETGELYPREYANSPEGRAPNELQTPEEQEDPNILPGTTVVIGDEDAEVVGGEEVPPWQPAPQAGQVEEESGEETPPPEEETPPPNGDEESSST